jgi:hypothetical protein
MVGLGLGTWRFMTTWFGVSIASHIIAIAKTLLTIIQEYNRIKTN